MADASTIVDLRRLINEPTDTAPWTDEVLSDRIDAHEGTLVSLAARIWREKAASYAELVDVKEGSSDRKLSQIYANMLKMADNFDAGDEVVTSARRVSRTRPIERQ